MQAGVDSSWLVLADSKLGAEIGRVLGDDSRVTVLSPSVLAEDADDAALTERPRRGHPRAVRAVCVA